MSKVSDTLSKIGVSKVRLAKYLGVSRQMLYNYLSYSTSVTINCIPKYYLEPNNLIYISDTKSNIQGDFFITQFTVPLTYNGTMSINTVQTLIRV